jgi:predicted membrane protein
MIMNKRNGLRAITLIVVVAIGAACCFIWKMQRTDDATSPDSWGKKVFVTSGVGIRSVCEPGMRISTILRRIGRYVKYHDSGDCYAKYEWGLDIFGVKGGVGARVDTMVFRVRPVEYGVTQPSDLCYRPDFSNEFSLFRGKLDETVDFSSGEVSVEEIVRKYGDCQVTFRQGEGWSSLEGVDSFKVEGVNGEVMCLNYKSRGVSFTFKDALVEAIVIFRPW